MADITPTEITQDPEGNIKGWKWASVTESDVCLPVRFSDKDDMTLSVHGTLDGAAWALRISSHSDTVDTSGLLTAYFPGTDANTGNAIALDTTNTASLVSETGVYYQPVWTLNTSGSTSLSVDIVLAGK